MDRETLFETQDIYLSAAITTFLKVEPVYRARDRRIFFCFAPSEDLYRAMGLYNAGAEVSVLAYADTIKRLRAEMYLRRHMEEVRINGGR